MKYRQLLINQDCSTASETGKASALGTEHKHGCPQEAGGIIGATAGVKAPGRGGGDIQAFPLSDIKAAQTPVT